MPNWCFTKYVLEGNEQETKALYELMKELEAKEKPAVPNGFGTTWLGCLVKALGGEWESIRCRGTWEYIELENGILNITTDTAWAPCNETFDFICKKFQSLRYYYQAEEPGLELYTTNDADGDFFLDRYLVDIHAPDGEFYHEYFESLTEAYEWIEETFDCSVKSEDDVKSLHKRWDKECDGYCYVHEFVIE